MRIFLGEPGPENREAEASYIIYDDRDNPTERDKKLVSRFTDNEEELKSAGIEHKVGKYAVWVNKRLTDDAVGRFIEDGLPLDTTPPPGTVDEAPSLRLN